ncbi:E3 ubiquitin-protein ligase TRIM7-like [Elgaria multicarinata webbii]|uniref:E3 ubiquitin-protein ligase TRIM7-like n=1 Tax=Elgaria multicarinata webbii TaxID=159646 RepID=UPI002FCD50AC
MGEVGEERSCVPSGADRPQERRCCCCSGQAFEMSKAKWLCSLRGSGREAMCAQHQEPLSVFCREDRALICIVCDKSRKHRTHLVLPIEEAAQDYKEDIQTKLRNLKRERDAVQEMKLTRERQTAEYLEDIKAKREKIVLEFQHLHVFLEEQQTCLLAQLAELEKEMANEQEETSSKLSNAFSVLGDLICDLEKDCQRPDREFLQNLEETLSRCEKRDFRWPVERSPDLEKDLSAISQKSIVLTKNLRKFKEILAGELKRDRTLCLNAVFEEQAEQRHVFWPLECGDASRKVSVTLDSRTASPTLSVSLDRKTVQHWDQPQLLSHNPERFDPEPFVMGYEGFCSGKHCWVVDVERGQSWAVGIARESVKRKGSISLSPEQGIWAVEQCWGQFQALTSRWTALPLVRKPRRIQVSLDYERGWVAFFDADLGAPIFTFPPVSFKQEKIYPWFWVGPGSRISLSH